MHAPSTTPEARSLDADEAMAARPIIFVDFDDVLVLNERFGGYDLMAPNPPPELWRSLFHRPALKLLEESVREFRARLVITTSWLQFLDREGFEELFRRTQMQFFSDALHEQWEVSQPGDVSRHDAIAGWLHRYHQGEPYVVLDDTYSGGSLVASDMDLSGRVVLCDECVGLLPEHVPLIRRALSTKPDRVLYGEQ